MKNEYVPSEKNRNMFGLERNGYGCERVDLYLQQLEVAFKKIREDNRALQHRLEETPPAAPAAPEVVYTPAPADPSLQLTAQKQEQYIMQLTQQLGESQVQVQQLSARLAEQAAIATLQPQNDALLAQMAALRAEADALRRQLAQKAQTFASEGSGEDQKLLIGKILVETRAQAEELLRGARAEAEQVTRAAQRRTEEMRAEQERIYAHLIEVQRALQSVLQVEPQPAQRYA